MTVIVVALLALAVLGLLALVHRWLWVRLVRDTTRPGGLPRRAGTALAFVLPLTAVAALVAGRAGAPFRLQQAVAWPGFMWLAVLLYLTLAMLVGEVARAVWLRRVTPRAAPAPVPVPASASAHASTPASAPVDPTTEPDPPAPAPAADPATATAPEPAFDAAVLTRRRFVARTVGGAAARPPSRRSGTGRMACCAGPA